MSQVLSANRLNAMINQAVRHPQQGAPRHSANVLAFRPRALLWGGGASLALAASIALAVLLVPFNQPTQTAQHTAPDSLSDVTDMITLDVLDSAV